MACKYILTVGGKELTFDTIEQFAEYVHVNQLYENINRSKAKTISEIQTEDLAKVLRQMSFGEAQYHPSVLRDFQERLLDEFIRIEDQSQFFYKVNSGLVLTKGLGKSMEQVDSILSTLADLGIYDVLQPNVPFDVRYLLTGDKRYKSEKEAYYHKLTAKNISILREIDNLSRLVFMDRSPAFVATSNKTLANLKASVASDLDKVKDLKDELSAFIQIAAYKKWIEINDRQTTTLRNSLIYDTENEDTIVDIVKKAISIAPNNTFLKFILPVSTVVKNNKKQNKKNINNRDLINTIEGKTRGHLEPDLMSSLMDSFTELYQNPNTRFHARALFDYLIVKDGLMFKNKSFIRLIPPFMFKEMSDATGIATELLSASSGEELKTLLKKLDRLEITDAQANQVDYFSSEEKKEISKAVKAGLFSTVVRDKLYEKVLGYSYNQMYNKFEEIYSTDVRHQFDLNLIRAKGNTPTIRVVKDEKKDTYMHITYFTEAYKKLPKDQKKAAKSGLLKELADAGVSVSPFTEKKEGTATDLEFKKFVRVQDSANNYTLYQLIQVSRDKAIHSGAAMTPQGELVPRGVYAVYKQIQSVGTPISYGVADLGQRPTKAQVEDTINSKTKKSSTPITQSFTGVKFEEDQSSGYRERTIKNASADATIAIAIDFNSAGEQLTKSSVLGQKKKYISVDANNLLVNPLLVESIITDLNSVNAKTLNIAGNGIYTMKGKYSQQQVDNFTYDLLNRIINSQNLKNKITQIRTGGQTGFDEAGAKAAMRLGIPTLILAPKGWKFRDINGNDISNEQQFKDRFANIIAPPATNPIAQNPIAPINSGQAVEPSQTPTTPPQSISPTSIGTFGGLEQYDFNPEDLGFDIGPDEIDEAQNDLDQC